jgi:hypothetical protein
MNDIQLSNIISWLTTIAVTFVIYLTYYRHQIKTAKSQKDIARLSILRSLEEDVMKIFKNNSAKELESNNDEASIPLEFRAVLDNIPPWEYIPDKESSNVAGWPPPMCKIIDGQRYWLIRKEVKSGKDQYLASQALQETLLWFRRMERGHKSGVIQSSDLADLWRFILPYGFSGRLSYMSRYFQGEEEVRSVVYIVNQTIAECIKQQWRKPVHYFREYITEEDLQVLRKGNEKLHSKAAEFGR